MATIRKRKNKWQVQVRRTGHRPIVKSFIQLKNAESWARHIETRLDKAHLPDLATLKNMTLGDLLTRYLAEVTPTKKSHRQEAYRIQRMLKEDLISYSLSSLNSRHLAAYRDKRIKQVGNQAVRHDLNLLSNLFKVAIQEWGIPLEQNPMQIVSKPRMPKGRNRRLTGEEARMFWSYINSLEDFWFARLLCLAIETGMRLGELLSLKISNVDLNKGVAWLPVTKNGEDRIVPLSPRAKQLIAAQSEGGTSEGILFNHKFSAVRYHWGKLKRALKLNDLHFHDLRHEALSRFFENGLSVPEVALISGHKDYRMLARYTHLKAEQIAQKMSDFVTAQKS